MVSPRSVTDSVIGELSAVAGPTPEKRLHKRVRVKTKEISLLVAFMRFLL